MNTTYLKINLNIGYCLKQYLLFSRDKMVEVIQCNVLLNLLI